MRGGSAATTTAAAAVDHTPTARRAVVEAVVAVAGAAPRRLVFGLTVQVVPHKKLLAGGHKAAQHSLPWLRHAPRQHQVAVRDLDVRGYHHRLDAPPHRVRGGRRDERERLLVVELPQPRRGSHDFDLLAELGGRRDLEADLCEPGRGRGRGYRAEAALVGATACSTGAARPAHCERAIAMRLDRQTETSQTARPSEYTCTYVRTHCKISITRREIIIAMLQYACTACAAA